MKRLPTLFFLAATTISAGVHADPESVPAWRSHHAGVGAVDNPEYVQTCGRCHFAYQPGLLPVLSWEHMLAKLPEHYGSEASIPESLLNRLRGYLLNNAAGRVPNATSMAVMASAPEPPPERITEIPYIRERHARVTATKLSDCGACHQGAAAGDFALQEE